MVVIKRNGNVVPFDKLKITSAIRKAMVECNVDSSNAEYVTEDVVKKYDTGRKSGRDMQYHAGPRLGLYLCKLQGTD